MQCLCLADSARKSKNFPIGLRAILEKQSLMRSGDARR